MVRTKISLLSLLIWDFARVFTIFNIIKTLFFASLGYRTAIIIALSLPQSLFILISLLIILDIPQSKSLGILYITGKLLCSMALLVIPVLSVSSLLAEAGFLIRQSITALSSLLLIGFLDLGAVVLLFFSTRSIYKKRATITEGEN